jgi:hypothetical protein
MSISTSIPTRGNFNGLNLPEWDREMIESGFQAVSSVEGGWEFLSTYEPPANQGFMFSTPPPKMAEIDNAVNRLYGGHSGASYGITMRVLQYIAKYGWDTYAQEMLTKYGSPPAPGAAPVATGAQAPLSVGSVLAQAANVDRFLSTIPPSANITQFADAIQRDPGMRASIPDIDNQADALRRFAEGKMTYAEMRSLCG